MAPRQNGVEWVEHLYFRAPFIIWSKLFDVELLKEG